MRKVTTKKPLVNFRSPGCFEMTTEQWKQNQKFSGTYYVSEFTEAGKHTHSRVGDPQAAYRQRAKLDRDHNRVPVFLTDAKAVEPPRTSQAVA